MLFQESVGFDWRVASGSSKQALPGCEILSRQRAYAAVGRMQGSTHEEQESTSTSPVKAPHSAACDLQGIRQNMHEKGQSQDCGMKR